MNPGYSWVGQLSQILAIFRNFYCTMLQKGKFSSYFFAKFRPKVGEIWLKIGEIWPEHSWLDELSIPQVSCTPF